MKPNDVYEMPSLKSDPIWYVNEDTLDAVFAMEESHLDLNGAEAANDQRIQRHLKMECVFTEDRSSRVYAMTLKGKPFGIYVEAGHNRDHTQFIPTDGPLHAEALGIVDGWRRRPRFEQVVDPSKDLCDITFFTDTAAIQTEQGFQLVDVRFVDNAGNLIFDPRLFLEAFRDFGKVLESLPKDETRGKEWVLERKAEIMCKAVPGHHRQVMVNEIWTNPNEERDDLPMWISNVLVTDEGTYAVGIYDYALRRSGFMTLSGMQTTRLGGPELFEQYVGKYGAASSAQTP